MAITRIDNQAIKLYTSTDDKVADLMGVCGNQKQNFCILAKQTDQYSLQVLLTAGSLVGWRIVSCDTDEVVFTDYSGQNVVYNSDFSRAQIKVLWGSGDAYGYSTLSDGCYRIEVIDIKPQSVSFGPELITNGNFTGGTTGWSIFAPWQYVSNNVDVQGAFSAVGNLYQDISVSTAGYYRLTFTVGGTIASGDFMNVYICSNLLIKITTAGSYSIDFYYSNNGECGADIMEVNFEFHDNGTHSDSTMTLDTVSCKKTTFSCGDIGPNIITNGTFATSSNWDVSNGWTISAGKIGCGLSGGETKTTYQDLPELQSSTRYKISFDVTGAITNFSTHVEVLVDGRLVFTISETGSYEFYIDTDTVIGTYRIEFIASSQSASSQLIFIDNVVMEQCIGTLASGGYSTDCFCLAASQPCSVLLSWTNDESIYGFDYESYFFEQVLRVRAKLGKGTYENQKDLFRFSNGNWALLFAQRKKTNELWMDELPEWVHDAISAGLNHDTFKIDDVEYVNEDGYEPEWEDNLILAQGRIPVIKKDTDTNEMNSFI